MDLSNILYVLTSVAFFFFFFFFFLIGKQLGDSIITIIIVGSLISSLGLLWFWVVSANSSLHPLAVSSLVSM